MKGVYVLVLEGGRYYVGWSMDIAKRVKEHFSGKGAKWTQKHKPIKVASKHPNATKEDEQLITKALMATHGKQNVRGGSYTSRGKLNPNLGGGCQAITKSGKACKAAPVKGSTKCMFHGGRKR